MDDLPLLELVDARGKAKRKANPLISCIISALAALFFLIVTVISFNTGIPTAPLTLIATIFFMILFGVSFYRLREKRTVERPKSSARRRQLRRVKRTRIYLLRNQGTNEFPLFELSISCQNRRFGQLQPDISRGAADPPILEFSPVLPLRRGLLSLPSVSRRVNQVGG